MSTPNAPLLSPLHVGSKVPNKVSANGTGASTCIVSLHCRNPKGGVGCPKSVIVTPTFPLQTL